MEEDEVARLPPTPAHRMTDSSRLYTDHILPNNDNTSPYSIDELNQATATASVLGEAPYPKEDAVNGVALVRIRSFYPNRRQLLIDSIQDVFFNVEEEIGLSLPSR